MIQALTQSLGHRFRLLSPVKLANSRARRCASSFFMFKVTPVILLPLEGSLLHRFI